MALSSNLERKLQVTLADNDAAAELITAVNNAIAGTSGPVTITSALSTALVVGPNGTTSPTFKVDASVASAATGLKVTGAAAAGGVALQVTSSGTNEALTIDAKAAALITLAGAAAGATGVQVGSSTSAATAVLTVQSTNASALAVGRQGATNPAFSVDASAATSVTGVKVSAAASGSGVTIAAVSSAAAEKLVLQTVGTSNKLTINDTLAAATAPLLQGQATDTIAGAVTDGYTGALELAPTVNAATALTMTRLNYVNCKTPALGGAGPAAVTDACLVRFDANAGTHKAVDSGTTKTSPGTVSAWVKVNLNGTVNYIPMYTSKTS